MSYLADDYRIRKKAPAMPGLFSIAPIVDGLTADSSIN